ncbi:MAG: ribose-phosphate pyrophosphokinase [Gammaproteobacteria bacterium]
MTAVVLACPGNATLAGALASRLGAEAGSLVMRNFPDGESYVRIDSPVAGREVILVCTLDRPNDKVLPLLLLAATARDLGASRIGLVAPYLAYMRQDDRFAPGEGITSRYFAGLVSGYVNWLVTVDPHLHRYQNLREIYRIPAQVARAAPLIAEWIRHNVPKAVLIGPDGESEQWISVVADGADIPFVVLQKQRKGDRDVEISVPKIAHWRERTPVLVDDIISTAHTMIQAVRQLRATGLPSPVCIGVHAIFADDAYGELRVAGAKRVVTCNTIPHASNDIDVTDLLADGVRAAFA